MISAILDCLIGREKCRLKKSSNKPWVSCDALDKMAAVAIFAAQTGA